MLLSYNCLKFQSVSTLDHDEAKNLFVSPCTSIFSTVILSFHPKLKIKSVTYSSQGNHTGQLDFCN